MVFMAFSSRANWSSWAHRWRRRVRQRRGGVCVRRRDWGGGLPGRGLGGGAYLVGEGFALEVGELLLHERVAEDRRHVVLLSEESLLVPDPPSSEDEAVLTHLAAVEVQRDVVEG